MARGRGGFIRRILHSIFPVIPSRPRPSPPSPPPEPPQPAPRGPREAPARPPRRRRELDPYEKIWQQERLGRPGRDYQAHRRFFNDLPGMEDIEPDERKDIWRTYLDTMVGGHANRRDPMNPFWRETGMHPTSGQFDWQAWRQTMGYGKKAA